jgi:superfamily II DNA/RNA helicase
MEHHVLHVAEDDKNQTVVRIAAREGRVLLFVDSKRGADRLAKRLLAQGVRAAALHGGKSQPQRTRVLDQFKDGQVSVLVATNVAARGIHIDTLDLVVNVDPPADHKDYLHRGGRTARAGASGSVVTLVLPEQRREMDRLTARAGISARTTKVRSSDAALAEITGAREPSGIPVTITPPAAAAPSAPARARARNGARRGRTGSGAAATSLRANGRSGNGGSGTAGAARSAGRAAAPRSRRRAA